MSSLRAYRYQLRNSAALARQLRRYAGQLRWLWNQALAEQRARHGAGEPYANYVAMAKWLTAWRNAPGTAWLAEGPVHPQQQVLKRLDEAYQRFFAKSGGFPAFKKRGDEPGLRFPDPKQIELDQPNGRIKLPKLGWVRVRLSRPVAGTVRNVSVVREGAGRRERWFASIQVEVNATVAAIDVAPTLGIDLGLAAFAATSEGVLVEPLQALARQQRRSRRWPGNSAGSSTRSAPWRARRRAAQIGRRRCTAWVRCTAGARTSAPTGCTSSRPSWRTATPSSPSRISRSRT